MVFAPNSVFTVSTALSLSGESSWKMCMVPSPVEAATIPVAILANTLRLTITVMLYDKISSEAAEKFCHDFAGIVMMPLAVAFLVGELWLLGWIANSGKPPASTAGGARR